LDTICRASPSPYSMPTSTYWLLILLKRSLGSCAY
jgi:hypothetical protein